MTQPTPHPQHMLFEHAAERTRNAAFTLATPLLPQQCLFLSNTDVVSPASVSGQEATARLVALHPPYPLWIEYAYKEALTPAARRLDPQFTGHMAVLSTHLTAETLKEKIPGWTPAPRTKEVRVLYVVQEQLNSGRTDDQMESMLLGFTLQSVDAKGQPKGQVAALLLRTYQDFTRPADWPTMKAAWGDTVTLARQVHAGILHQLGPVQELPITHLSPDGLGYTRHDQPVGLVLRDGPDSNSGPPPTPKKSGSTRK